MSNTPEASILPAEERDPLEGVQGGGVGGASHSRASRAVENQRSSPDKRMLPRWQGCDLDEIVQCSSSSLRPARPFVPSCRPGASSRAKGHEHVNHHGRAPLPALILVQMHYEVLNKIRGGLDVLGGDELLSGKQDLHQAPAALEL
eukprot:CAMPEP_0175800222 /NCGR_PEP_ID=MMETSP0097-20121207/86902_1 /TAXON_ID=311494 /ORGANISM="Alexandrium monilatum, Strain CCMP3105" /LENGTH=145 /DNA_ID=CAMNT_0017111497 /DNA_START=155 /DNA_END=594 /DNA_ORIENTATION=-